jgi:putative endonuclease
MMRKLTQLVVRVLDAATRRKRSPEVVPDHLKTGKRGEEAAYFRLRAVGYVVVARNWRSRRRKGEIDLIAWDGDVLCFIEVKTRSTRDVKPAEAAVDRAKQNELRAMAREYVWRSTRRSESIRMTGLGKLRNSASQFMKFRFDIVSVYYDGNSVPTEIALFQNAFPLF